MSFRHLMGLHVVQAIAKSYGAAKVTFSDEAEKKIELYTRAGFDKLPICMAKTQYRCTLQHVLCCKWCTTHPISMLNAMLLPLQLQRRSLSEGGALRF